MLLLISLPAGLQPQLALKPTFDMRERIERRIDRDFSSGVPDGRTDALTRVRLGVEASYGKRWSGALEGQYAHDAFRTDSANGSTENSDASLAYVRHQADGVETTVGRQKIAFGQERLVGNLEWGNVPRSYDGIRVSGANWSVFGAAIGVSSPRLPDVRLAGAAYRSRLGETLVVHKHDEPASGDVDVTTLSHRFSQKLGGLDFECEAAVQTGEVGARDLEAWALHASASGALGARASAFVEVNAASGGGDASKSRTFDNLYPTNHNKYGIADLQGWRNMNEIAFGIAHSPKPGASLKLSYRVFTLRDATDAWYGAGGAPNKRAGGTYLDPTGASGRSVGSEWDLEGSYRLSSSWSVGWGVAVFEPGSFVRALNGGSADRSTWGFFAIQGRW